MPDREKVVKIIDELIFEAQKEPTWKAENALRCLKKELLKEQEAVVPKRVKGYNPPMYTIYGYKCEECKSPMMSKQPFCMGCGRAVKWK